MSATDVEHLACLDELVRAVQAATSELTFEDRQATWCAAFEYGYTRHLDDVVEDLVQARLHERACEMLGLAKRYARRKCPAWTAMIIEAGEDG